jgi:hypothetical protein
MWASAIQRNLPQARALTTQPPAGGRRALLDHVLLRRVFVGALKDDYSYRWIGIDILINDIFRNNVDTRSVPPIAAVICERT